MIWAVIHLDQRVGCDNFWLSYCGTIVLPDHSPRWQDELRHSTLHLGRAAAVYKDIGATHYLNLK